MSYDSFYKGKRILVTGGAGFLGSFYASACSPRARKCFAWTIILPAAAPTSPSLCESDVRSASSRRDYAVVRRGGCDIQFRLPGVAVHYHSSRGDHQGQRTRGDQHAGTCQAPQVSNSPGIDQRVYGDPSVHPQTKTTGATSIPSALAHATTKASAAQNVVLRLFAADNVAIKVMRIFNTYGPRMNENDGRVVSNFIIRALRGQPIEIYGTGTQTRSFCYVDDLIEGTQKFMKTSDEVTGPINVGNPTECSILELAETIVRITRSSSKIVFLSASQDDPKRRRPDISLAKAGWMGASSGREAWRRRLPIFGSSCRLDRSWGCSWRGDCACLGDIQASRMLATASTRLN